MLSLSDNGGVCLSKVTALEILCGGLLPLLNVDFPFVPREIGIGFELDEGLAEVEGRPESWRRARPFTVEACADGLPAGALFDMGRTFGKPLRGKGIAGVWRRFA